MVVGGKKTRAGAGTSHSQLSIRQTQNIPSAPGKAGRPVNVKPRQFYVPAENFTSPQRKHTAPGGTWAHVDTTFTDTLSVDEQYPGRYQEALQGLSHMDAWGHCQAVVSSLIADANRMAQYKDPVNFLGNSLEMNSGPTYEDLALRAKKRRMWFSLVRAYHDSFVFLWGRNLAAPTCAPSSPGVAALFCTPKEVLELVSSLAAANVNAVTSAAQWENEPPECYRPLDVTLPREVLRSMIEAKPTFYNDLTPSQLVELAPIVMDGGALPQLFAAFVSHPKASVYTALAFAQTVGGAELLHNGPLGTLCVFVGPNGVDAERANRIARFLALLADDASGRALDNHTIASATVYAKVCTAIYRNNPPAVCDGVLSMQSYVARVLRFAQSLTEDNSKTHVNSDGYLPVRDFEEGMRLAHKDVHPHYKLQVLHGEGLETVRLGGSADTGLGEAITELNLVASRVQAHPLVTTIQQRSGGAFRMGGWDRSALINTISHLLESNAAPGDVRSLLQRLDRAVSVSSVVPKEDVIGLLEVYARAAYQPLNRRSHEVCLLKSILQADFTLPQIATIVTGCVSSSLLTTPIAAALEGCTRRALRAHTGEVEDVARILVGMSHALPRKPFSDHFGSIVGELTASGKSFHDIREPSLAIEFAEVLPLSEVDDGELLQSLVRAGTKGGSIPWSHLSSLLSTLAARANRVSREDLEPLLSTVIAPAEPSVRRFAAEACDNMRLLTGGRVVLETPLWPAFVSEVIAALQEGELTDRVRTCIAFGSLLQSQGVSAEDAAFGVIVKTSGEYFTLLDHLMEGAEDGDTAPNFKGAVDLGRTLEGFLSSLGLIAVVESSFEGHNTATSK